MKAISLLLVGVFGHSVFAAHPPAHRVLPSGAPELIEKADYKLVDCVSSKHECKELAEKEGVEYFTKRDATGCEAVSDEDDETMGCYLER